jgi:acyl-CoA synthetase (AMP-forming)/AMP-acid ligase II/1-acyl-sn-glycerol-3-phosphate acyltransferase/acyl carrier protein
VRTWTNGLFWAICRLLLSFRYKVTISGAEQLRSLKGPTLVLPNHPAYIDPPLVSSHIRLHKPLRPLVFSGTYRLLFLRPLMAMVNAFEVPDLSAHSRDAQAKTLEMIDAVVDRLHAGDCLLIYPSGRLQRGDREVVGAARAVYEIVSRCPDINVVLIRTRGVWGSMYSCAETGASPSLARCIRSSAGWVLASLFFFLPKRGVTMQVEVVDRSQLPMGSREQFNAYLEGWYNVDGGQEPAFVRYHYLFGPSQGNYRRLTDEADYDLEKIKPKTIGLVNELIQSHLGRQLPPEEMKADTPLEQIGLDSLDRMDLALKIEQQFGFRSNIVASTLGQLWALADGQLSQSTEQLTAPEAWSKPKRDRETPRVLAETIGEAFVRRALKQPRDVAVADALSGVLSYRRLLVGAELMSRRLAKFEEPHLGIMLPASVAADLVFFATHLAGKVPVMMNWTTGPTNLAHGVQVTGVKRILTSRKMVDRLGIEVAGADYVFLEDIKASIKKPEAVLNLLRSIYFPGSFHRQLPTQQPEETAVFLFTSGSESMPKTVPLSHRNLLVNVVDSLEVLAPEQTESLLGFLPPFHSFGLTGNLLLPHLSGIPSVRYADPTDASGLVRTIAAYKPTMLFTTPTFLGYIMSACKGDELHSLRKLITGAEKCSPTIFQQCARLAPNATILEGYGITECSPVVSANRLSGPKLGSVGRPVTNVEVCIVDLDSDQPISDGTTGMLLVAGPSIFNGYYQHDGPSPFVELDGKSWYKTGDLVSMDEEGCLHFRGRLKRFLKAGGEMISLPALEEPFSHAYPADENGPKVAVEGVETEDGRHIVLFTTMELSLREAGELLLKAGMRGVMRLDEVRRVESIPVLGTGKIDYKVLRKKILESLTSQT